MGIDNCLRCDECGKIRTSDLCEECGNMNISNPWEKKTNE